MPGFSSYRKAALLSIGRDERSGFGEVHRGFNESEIVADVAWKLPSLGRHGSTYFEIGCGCSSLTHELLNFHTIRGECDPSGQRGNARCPRIDESRDRDPGGEIS